MMMDPQQQQQLMMAHQQQQQQQLQLQQVPFLNLQSSAAGAVVGSSSTSRSSTRGRGAGKSDPLGSSTLSSALTSAALGGRSVTGTATTTAATATAFERRAGSGGKQVVEEHEESDDQDDDDGEDDQLDDGGGSSKKKPRSSFSGSDKVAQSRERNKIHARKSRLRKKFLLDNLKANLGGVEEENENLRMMVVKLTGKTYEELMADNAAGLPMVAIPPPIATGGLAVAAAAQAQGVVVTSPRIAPSGGLALPLGGIGGGGGGGGGGMMMRPADGFAVQLQPVASSLPFAQALNTGVTPVATAATAPSSASATQASLQAVPSSVINSNDFELVKALALAQHNFVISDPSLPDNPIVFASAGFYSLTGYAPEEVIGRNCRFLQGAATDPRAIAAIRKGVVEGKDTAVCLINYKKDGTSFWNRFFIAALKSSDGKIVNYVGVQCQVSDALARVLVDMQSRRRNDADGTPLTAEAEVADVSILSASVSSSSSSSASSSAPATTSV
jgi:ribosomal protein L12E/L44/L45/RPP1/RPP2